MADKNSYMTTIKWRYDKECRDPLIIIIYGEWLLTKPHQYKFNWGFPIDVTFEARNRGLPPGGMLCIQIYLWSIVTNVSVIHIPRKYSHPARIEFSLSSRSFYRKRKNEKGQTSVNSLSPYEDFHIISYQYHSSPPFNRQTFLWMSNCISPSIVSRVSKVMTISSNHYLPLHA